MSCYNQLSTSTVFGFAIMLMTACGTSDPTPSASAADSPPATVKAENNVVTEEAKLKSVPDDQKWKGAGALFTLEGKKIADYELEMHRKKLSASNYSNAVKIRFQDGTIKEMNCKMEQADQRWKSDCGDRKGGGYCLGEGLCIDYIVDDKSHAFATTIIMDGDSQMRIFRTEFDGGKAVCFFREKLTLIR